MEGAVVPPDLRRVGGKRHQAVRSPAKHIPMTMNPHPDEQETYPDDRRCPREECAKFERDPSDVSVNGGHVAAPKPTRIQQYMLWGAAAPSRALSHRHDNTYCARRDHAVITS